MPPGAVVDGYCRDHAFRDAEETVKGEKSRRDERPPGEQWQEPGPRGLSARSQLQLAAQWTCPGFRGPPSLFPSARPLALRTA